jgi:endo-1,3-1,4-beta-glycanase ExoK
MGGGMTGVQQNNGYSGAGRSKGSNVPKLRDDFNSYNPQVWQKRDGKNGDPFDCDFRSDNIKYEKGQITFVLDKSGCPDNCEGLPYASGEIRTGAFYSYGTYEVNMKAASGNGLITSFYTYTGPWENNPEGKNWDEIDVEAFGYDNTKIQVNYWTNGVQHPAVIDLANIPGLQNINTSTSYHTYKFDWEKNGITWYVDNIKVHEEDGSRGPLPTHQQKIMMNMWPCTDAGWTKAFTWNGIKTASYDWMQYTPSEETSSNKGNAVENRSTVAPKNTGGTGELLDKFVTNQGAFNGASAYISNGKIELSGTGTDMGFAMNLKAVSGKLAFDYAGSAQGGYRNNGFTVIFIKAGPNGDYTQDEQLGEQSFQPGKASKSALVDIPAGTTKINVQGLGQMSMNVVLQNVRVIK